MIRHLCAVLPLVLLLTHGALAAPEPIAVTAIPVPLMPEDPDETRAGALRYGGGLHLRADDRRFGGVSGLWVSPDRSRFVAVSDMGYWVEGALELEAGRLTGASTLRIGPILNQEGRPVVGKRTGDAEALADDNGRFLVSFERDHRVWRYEREGDGAPFAARPKAEPMPQDFDGVPDNKGLEGLAVYKRNRLLMTEGALDADGYLRGWYESGPESHRALRLKAMPPYGVTDLSVLPGGDLLVLERRYSPFTGTGIQLRRLAAADLDRAIADGTPLDGPVIASLDMSHTVDNMEGLAVVSGEDGRIWVFLVSDDNYNRAMQKTLIMMFELTDE